MLFNKPELTACLDQCLTQSEYDLSVHDSIDSTNNHLQNTGATDYPQICVANVQTAGRGRFGKVWDSEVGNSLCLSIRLPMQQKLEYLMGFSLVVALAIKSVIQPLIRTDIQLKWPNDILVDNKKLCGILIETNTRSTLAIDLVIGVGLNIKAVSASHYDAISLDECGLKSDYNPNKIAAELINEIVRYTQAFSQDGFEPFRQSWLEQERWLGAEVSIVMANGNKSIGRYEGIDHQGQIQILQNDEINAYNAGEISLRRI